MVSLAFMVILAAAALTAVGVGFRQRWVVVAVPSILFGGLSYFFVSMYAARFLGVGRFFSLPFGGFAVTDWNITVSTLFWVVLWAVVLHLAVPRWGREDRVKPGRKVNWGAVSVRVLLCVAPLALTPLLGWLISYGYLNFGGGCKDIVMIFPWMAWSLVYFIFFVTLTAKKAALGKTVAWSAAGATGILGAAFAVIYAFSLAGVG